MSTTIIKKNKEHKHYDAMVIAALPLIISSTIMFGIRVIFLSLIAVITVRTIDVLSSMLFNTELDTSDKSSIVAALVFTLMLPVSIPIHVLVVTLAITIFVGKHIFGGSGSYPFSLPALAICFAAVNWPEEVFKVVQPFTKVDFFGGGAAESATHTTVIKQGGLPQVSLIDMLLGNYASAMGTSFILIIIAIGIYLIVTKRIPFRIPVAYLVTYILMSLLFPRIYGISLMDNLILEVLTGGCVFYAFFVISEPSITPKGKEAQIVYGVLAGVLGVLFTYFGAYEIGVCFAILILNAMQRSIEESVLTVQELIKNKKSKPVSKAKKPVERKLETQNKKVSEKPEIKEESAKIEEVDETNIAKTEETKKEKIEEDEKVLLKAILEEEAKEDINYSPLDLIKKAEDDIDEVIFSTQSFSMQELLEETRKEKTKRQTKQNAENKEQTPQNLKPRKKKRPQNKKRKDKGEK